MQNTIYNKAFKHGIRPEDILRSIHALNPTAFRAKYTGSVTSAAHVARGVRGYSTVEAMPVMLKLLGMDSMIYMFDGFGKGTLTLTPTWSHVEVTSRPDIRVVIVAHGALQRTKIALLGGKGSDWSYSPSEKIQVSAKSSMPDTLVINNKTYVIDSTLLSSYTNSKNGKVGHAIAGISCNKSKMYYNGWSRSASKSRPCPLIDVDWTKRGIFLVSSSGTETLQSEFCHMNARKSPTDFSFDGSSETQDQLRVYVLEE